MSIAFPQTCSPHLISPLLFLPPAVSVCPANVTMNSSDAFLDPCETRGQTRRCLSAVEPGSLPAGDTGSSWDAEEEEDRFLGVPLRRACGHQAAMQAYDPFRRHSWEPGKKLQGAAGYEQMR